MRTECSDGQFCTVGETCSVMQGPGVAPQVPQLETTSTGIGEPVPARAASTHAESTKSGDGGHVGPQPGCGTVVQVYLLAHTIPAAEWNGVSKRPPA